MKKILTLCCALALAGLSASAMAAGEQGFVRVEAGRSDLDIKFAGAGSDTDNDTAWSVRGGYWFTSHFGAEVFYTTQYDKTFNALSVEISGFGVGAVAKKNFGANDHGLFVSGRGGMTHLEGKLANRLGSGSAKESSDKPYLGVGVGYDFNEVFGLSLNYDYQQADFFNASVDMQTVTLGAELRF